jgi:hypothetical protein
MQLLSWYLDLGKPVVALQAPPPDRRRTPCLRPNSKGSSRWAAGRHDPGVTELALPALALDRLEAVVFDTDGVLTDTASVHAAAWKRLFDEYLQLRATRDGEPFRPFTEADYLRSVDGRPRYDDVASFLASRGITLPWGDPDDTPDRETVCGLGQRQGPPSMGRVPGAFGKLTRSTPTAADGEVGQRADEVDERGRDPQLLAAADPRARAASQVPEGGGGQGRLDHGGGGDRRLLAAAQLAPAFPRHRPTSLPVRRLSRRRRSCTAARGRTWW